MNIHLTETHGRKLYCWVRNNIGLTAEEHERRMLAMGVREHYPERLSRALDDLVQIKWLRRILVGSRCGYYTNDYGKAKKAKLSKQSRRIAVPKAWLKAHRQ